MITTSLRTPKVKTLTQPPQIQPLRLNDIRDNAGARKKEVRVGRGRGSGCGKTSGRGQKGQRARNSVPLGFEGGQTPLQKRLPKRNRFDPFERVLQPISLAQIQRFIDTGRLDPTEEITMRELFRSKCIKHVKDGSILVPWAGEVMEGLRIQVTETTPAAARQVVERGGIVTLAWYNRLGLRALMKPEKWTEKGLPLPRWARPKPKMEHRYPDRIGYLPVRVLKSLEDVAELEEGWKRVMPQREAPQEM